MNTVIGLFTQAVKKFGSRTAVVDDKLAISYNELDAWSNQIAADISKQNLLPESPVIVLLPRSAKYIASILGILKSGCCYIPIDSNYPEHRIKYIADKAKVNLFICDNSSCGKIGKETAFINLDELSKTGLDNFVLSRSLKPDSLAYIIFTSGSTGNPKGVEVEHHSLLNLVKWHHRNFSHGEYHRVIIAASIGFDASVWETWSNITVGNTIYIIKQELILNPPELARWLENNEIDECFLPTPLAEKLLEQKFSSKAKLKYLHAGGERLKKYPPADFPAVLTNLYGPTECTVIAVWAEFKPGELFERPPVIGKAVDNCTIYILDDSLNPVPAGKEGEIYIGGACLARGYHNLPEETEKSFIANPFDKDSRIYRTGDIGLLLADGNYDFIGRRDFQIKIRGNRIELGEVEAVLDRHPVVNKSVVIVRENTLGIKYLAAYLNLNKKEKIDISEFEKIVAEYLPDYMRPQVYTVLDTFPLTSHGKIDRDSLPEPDMEFVEVKNTDNPIESALMQIWVTLLKTRISSTESSFYSQGGDSLLLVSLALEIEKVFNQRLSISSLIANNTIKTQAFEIEKNMRNNDSYYSGLVNKKIYSRVHATSSQKKMWRQDSKLGNGGMFNVPMQIHLEGKLLPEAVEKALNCIISRHSQLHTRFEFVNGILYQIKENDIDFKLPFADLSSYASSEKLTLFDKFKQKYRTFKFDFNIAPLITGKLFKFNENHYELLLTIHHLVFDGWSSTIFFDELAKLCSGFTRGEKLKDKYTNQFQYSDYVYWQERWLESEAAEKQMSFWRKFLKGAKSTPSLPFERDNAGHDLKAERWYFEIDEKLTSGLRQVASTYDTTLFVILQATLQLQIYRHTAAVDLTTGTAVANRNIPGSENIIGLFINSLAIRGNISGNSYFNKFIKQLSYSILEILKKQEYPFELVAENVHDVTRHKGAVFNISLLLQNIPHSAWEYPGVTLKADELGSDIAKLDIMITLEEREGKIIGWYEYKDAKFSRETIESMQKDFCCLLKQVADKPELRVNDYKTLEISQNNKPTCFVFGETGMAISACEILREAGFHIFAVISDDQQVLDWAAGNSITSYMPHKDNIEDILKAVPFDYLFSIIYRYIIKDEILRLPKYEAVNYHDSPLPRYAGMYATSWAILNQEKTHAVSWHRMTKLVDGGDILKQCPVDIETDENVESLNLKCTAAGLNSFRELLEEFKNDKLEAYTQDLSKRSCHGLYQRPDNLGFIDCMGSTAETYAIVKASNYNNVDNVFGSAKFVYGQDYYIVGKAKYIESKDSEEPGKIIASSSDSITVRFVDKTLELSELKTLDGNPVDCGMFSRGKSISYPPINNSLFRETYLNAIRAEKYWINKLREFSVPEIPLIKFDESQSEVYKLNTGGLQYSAAALIGVFISRLLCCDKLFLVLNCSAENKFPGLYVDSIPWKIEFNSDDTAVDILEYLEQNIANLLERQPPLYDIYYRYKNLPRPGEFPFELKITDSHTFLRSAPGKNCEAFVRRFELFCSILKNLINTPVKQLPLVTEKELITQIENFNLSERDYDLSCTWVDLFKKRLPEHADSIAVVFEEHRLTYSEIDKLSDCVATEILQNHNNSASRTAAVFAKRSKALIPVLLGIFKAGFTYLPIELERYPSARIQHILDDAGCKIIINLDKNCNDVSVYRGDFSILDFSDGIEKLEPEVSPDFEVKTSPEDNAYIIYTSGSSGTPKGVIISQKNLLNHNLGVIDDFELKSSDRILQFGALGFDLSIEEIFPALLTGASLILLPDGIMENQLEFLEFIKQERISVLDLPTAYWHKLADLLKDYPLPDSLRLTVIGGEKAALEAFEQWRRFSKGCRLINTYGPTETTIIATAGEQPETIGKPVANTHVYILDAYMKPVPVGVKGELFIGGTGVGKGYLNQPFKSAEFFIENPYRPGEKMYRTGDLAEFTKEGELVFRGRHDNQVKLRGFRIELGDIETALKSHPLVVNAVVCIKTSGKNKILSAYVIFSEDNYDKVQLIEYLKDLLPEYMVPASITRISHVPLNINGKIDFSQLPDPVVEGDDESIDSINKLLSPLEMQVSLLLERLLGCKRANLDKTFVESGVDSLMVTEIMLELEKFTGRKITLEGFWHLTIREYLRKIETDKNNTQNEAMILLADNGKKAPLYLIHTLPGDILSYIDLVRTLTGRPIYGIQSPYLKKTIPQDISLEKIAEQYVDLIIANNHGEKIYLCGWCFGGILAVEMAEQLKVRGYDVAFLGLIETWFHTKKLTAKLSRIYDLIRCGPSIACRLLKKRFLKDSTSMENLEKADFLEKRFSLSASGKIAHLKKLYALNLKAGRNYTMKYYAGHLELFRSSVPPEGIIPSESLRWQGYCDSYNMNECPGEHQQILQYPNVEILGNKINNILAELESEDVVTYHKLNSTKL